MSYIAIEITDKKAVEYVNAKVNPDVVIHCATCTAVDMTEDNDKVELVRAVNSHGT